jgi:3'(2'), 5'-bisphosphate nucleotidase
MAAADNQALLTPVQNIAHAAGVRIMEFYEYNCEITHKENNTPLTEADLAAHETIMQGLGRLTPDIPILSEESASIGYAERRAWQRYWLVDPLDGTREFIKHNGEFTVNIALIEGNRPVLGVVYSPVMKVHYYACAGFGAYKQELGSQPVRISTRNCDAQSMTVACSRSHRGDTLEGFLARLGNYEIVNMGSSLKFCLVAEGKADIYPRFGPTSEWDTAAAQCVVEEAGGKVTDVTLQALRYNTKDSLLNPHFLVFGDPQQDWSRYL